MKVLHINQSDVMGGAAIAGYRLHEGLLLKNIDSKLLVGHKTLNSAYVENVGSLPKIENRIKSVTEPLGLNHIHHVNSFRISKRPFYQNADVLNFHNLHTGFFNYLAFPHLTRKKPAVFTLHDMWSFTGHCVYSYDCQKWETGCGKCPYPDTYPSIKHDNTALVWKLKNLVYKFSNLSIVAPSRWLENLVKKSMLNRFPIYCIPNGLNTDAFRPYDRDKCFFDLGIDSSKKVLLFAAESIQNKRKGGDLLLSVLKDLSPTLKRELLLLTIGKEGKNYAEETGIEHRNLGYLWTDYDKAIAYSAADLFIFPTRADNLPLVLQESMACGTPMVSFDIGGVSDIVRPGLTGYLAKAEDTSDLSKGIQELLEDQSLREEMSSNCRQIAVDEYSLELQTDRYINLYKKILFH